MKCILLSQQDTTKMKESLPFFLKDILGTSKKHVQLFTNKKKSSVQTFRVLFTYNRVSVNKKHNVS